MFSLKSARSSTNLAPTSPSNSTPLSSPRPTKPLPAGLQSPLQLSTPPLSETSESTLQSTSSDGWSPTDERGFDEARARGRSQRQAESEGSSGGGRGFGSFFKRVRSSSRGRKKEEQLKVHQSPPPVPAVPSDFRLSLGLGSMGDVAGMGIGGCDGPARDVGINIGDELETESKTAPGDGGDLGDLLYLVQAAGDRFASDASSTDWSLPSPSPPPTHPSPQTTTPTLLQPSAFSSPGSPPSPATPKPYYSFLSHLGNASLPSYPSLSSPSSPPFLRTPPPPKPDSESEDDYGASSSDEEAVWRRKPNTSFGRPHDSVASAPAPKLGNAFRPAILSPTRARRRALGPKAKDILDYTLLRLAPSPSTLSTTVPSRYQPSSLQYPLSSTLHRTIAAFGPTNTIRVVLGRTLIARKLIQGLTMLESMDLEQSASRRRRASQDSQSSGSTAGSFDETTPRPTLPSLTLLIDTFVIEASPSLPVRPVLSPLAHSTKPPSQSSLAPSLQPARLRTWIARPSFAESHLNTVVIEGGTEMVDLVRPARGRVPKLAVSERLRAMAEVERAEMIGHGKEKMEGRRVGERAGVVASATGRKPVLPGPLLLRALAEKELNGTGDSSDEEDLPLAVLRSRGSTTPASASPSSAASSATRAALRKAQARTEKLETEVSKLRKQEEARKGRLSRMQREKEEREIEWEEDKREEERKGRVAEQRRRSRATRQVDDKPVRSNTKDMQHKRASAAPPKQQPSAVPSPSAYAAPFPPTPSNPWAHPQMLAVPPPGWGIVPIPVMMPLQSPNATPPFYSPQPSPLFSTSAPSHTSTSPFSTFAQAGAHRAHPPPPQPHSHSAPNQISHRATSRGPSSSSTLKPSPNAPNSMRRSSSHGPPLNHRSSRQAPPPLLSAMATGKRVCFRPAASVVETNSVRMGRTRSTPARDVVERERAKAQAQLVGGAGAGGGKPARR